MYEKHPTALRGAMNGFGQFNNLKDYGTKAISKCEVNPTSGFQATTFSNNILHRVQC